jgi:hypothetical protein
MIEVSVALKGIWLPASFRPAGPLYFPKNIREKMVGSYSVPQPQMKGLHTKIPYLPKLITT